MSAKKSRKAFARNGSLVYQTILAHTKGVAKYSKEFMAGVSNGYDGQIAGRLHDIGKYSNRFQLRLEDQSVRVVHAFSGAIEAENLIRERLEQGRQFHDSMTLPTLRLIGQSICGHHAGLSDYGPDCSEGSYAHKILRTGASDSVEDYSSWTEENSDFYAKLSRDVLTKDNSFGHKFFSQADMNFEESDILNDYGMTFGELLGTRVGFSMQHYGRYLFSSLVDADRLDAQNFPYREAEELMTDRSTIDSFHKTFFSKLKRFDKKVKAKGEADTELNKLRFSIRENCLAAAKKRPGFFSLTVPTGSGKTLSSMAFALEHAKKYKKDRIIYTIPYISIIEQNALVFKKYFGKENVVEHHSNFDWFEEYKGKYTFPDPIFAAHKLATENWHERLIVTTNVQFFESLFTNRAGRARKVHNIYNSVIVLDEVQMIPNFLIKPCMEMLRELVDHYKCTIVLCSATQPGFDMNRIFYLNTNIREIAKRKTSLYKALVRTRAKYLDTQSLSEIANKINKQDQVLCIVNTRRHAYDLYTQVKESACEKAKKNNKDGLFHLSTTMYPIHRKAILRRIRNRLKKGLPCKVISTQLIEAGVDLDFPVVYRSLAGVDSLAQANGRCNREGKLKYGKFFVFKPEEQYRGLDYLRLTSDIADSILHDYKNFLGLRALTEYYHRLFDYTQNRLDREQIMRDCLDSIVSGTDLQVPYETIAKKVRFVESQEIPIIIPKTKAAKAMIAKIEHNLAAGISIKIPYRKVQSYSITIRPDIMDRLLDLEKIRLIELNGLLVLQDLTMYDWNTGFDL